MCENTDYETLKAERDSALNTCSLIAEALGITGAVAGDTIAKVHQLVGENVVLKSAIEFATAPDMWEEHGDLLEYKYLDWYVDVLNKALDGTPATTQALNEIKAQGVMEFATSRAAFLSGYEHAEKFAASLRGEHEIKS
ncbi:Uncharacterised protein [Yersinia intermedia]|uniref:hypothetical protein n=1 Tax=Yersinia intermedia TaxID=631 RepID=UPI0005E49924|nr:hypothetical protein [Yersinia intermedia]CQE04513.1 Uncharacterised protein [Yersinia intermedia]